MLAFRVLRHDGTTKLCEFVSLTSRRQESLKSSLACNRR